MSVSVNIFSMKSHSTWIVKKNSIITRLFWFQILWHWTFHEQQKRWHSLIVQMSLKGISCTFRTLLGERQIGNRCKSLTFICMWIHAFWEQVKIFLRRTLTALCWKILFKYTKSITFEYHYKSEGFLKIPMKFQSFNNAILHLKVI